MYIKVRKLNESGCEEALFGIGLSFGLTSEYIHFDNCPIELQERLYERAKQLAPLGKGHNKFLESICVWLDITAPRYWWSEADTYRCGSSKQSESTMHTLIKEFKGKDYDQASMLLEDNTLTLDTYKEINLAVEKNDLVLLKQLLPESFLQRRIWCLNYKVIQNIIHQRQNHKLPHWKIFCDSIINQLNHSDLLGI